VLTLRPSAADSNRSVTFFFAGTTSGQSQFALNSQTGVVTLATPLDFESGIVNFTLTFGLRDGFYPFREDTNATAIITVSNINDHAPVFAAANASQDVAFLAAVNGTAASYTARLYEGSAANTTLLRVAALDLDAGATAAVRFTWENPSAVPALLHLDEITGIISITTLVFNVDFQGSQLVVLASDSDGLFSRADVIVLYSDNFDHFEFQNNYVGRGGSFGVRQFGPATLDVAYPYTDVGDRPSTGIVVRGTLAYNTDGLWYDSRVFRVLLQAIDSESRVPTSRTTVFARVVPTAAFTSALQSAGASSSTGIVVSCRTSTTQGLCTATFTLPTSWFTSSIPAANLTVAYGEGTGSLTAAAASIGTVAVNNQPSNSGSRVVILSMPFRGVKTRQQLRIPILANSVYSTASWQLQVDADAGLTISSISVDSSRWTIQAGVQNGGARIVANAILAAEEPGIPTIRTGLEELGQVVVTVGSSATVGSRLGLRCTILFLESAIERNVVAAGTAATFIDRTTRSGTLPSVG
jgi:hypothetical protein